MIKLKEAQDRVAQLEKELLAQKKSSSLHNDSTQNDDNNQKSELSFNMNILESILLKLADNKVQQKDSSLRPPNIQIPTFTGEITQFQYFKEAVGRVLNNVTWGNIEKFVFLREHLAGDPLNMVKMILMDDEAYDKAWGILERYYDSQRRLVTHNIKLLSDKNFQSIEKDDESLKTFTQTYEAIRANFSQINVTADQILAEIVISRMDELTASRCEDFLGFTKTTPTLTQISDFLTQENIKREIKIIRTVSEQKWKAPKQHVSRAHVTQRAESQKPAKSCFICKSAHDLFTCPAFVTSSDKVELMKKYKLCIFCGKHKYDRRNVCRSREYLQCNVCKLRHATELHVKKPINPPIDTNSAATENGIQTLVTQQTSRTCSLMPTAIVQVVLTDHQTIPVRVLIDQCAERSYITEKITSVLGLKTFKSRELVKGINNITTQASKYTNFAIKFNDLSLKNLDVNAIVLPEISGKIPCTTLINKTDFNIPLAEPTYKIPAKVEIL